MKRLRRTSPYREPAAATPAPGDSFRRQAAAALVTGYVGYHLERRLRSYPLVAR